jgi:hypothetical protein
MAQDKLDLESLMLPVLKNVFENLPKELLDQMLDREEIYEDVETHRVNMITHENVLKDLEKRIQVEENDEDFQNFAISAEVAEQGKKEFETISRRLRDLPDDVLEEYANELEELYKTKIYGREGRLRDNEKAEVVAKFKEISKKYGIAFPPVLMLLLSIGSFVFNLIKFILFLRDRRRKQPAVQHEDKEAQYKDEDKPVFGERAYEGWITDKILSIFKTQILPKILINLGKLLDEKREIIKDLVISAIRDGLESALTKLSNKLQTDYQSLIE